MVLESLFSPFIIKRKPWEMLAAGALYSVISFFLAYMVFRSAASMLMVFFIVMAALPIFFTTIKSEEEIDNVFSNEWAMLKEHTKVIDFLILFFVGVTATLALLYVFLPSEMVDQIFSLQTQTITHINSGATSTAALKNILLNNVKVMFFSFIFSFIFGTGALFILTWNASVVAAAIGAFIKNELAIAASSVGLTGVAAYFSAFSFGFLRYLLHGIPEMLSYWIAGLAGGIISVAVIKHHLRKEKILFDASQLMLIAMGILIVAGIMEVYLTPLFF